MQISTNLGQHVTSALYAAATPSLLEQVSHPKGQPTGDIIDTLEISAEAEQALAQQPLDLNSFVGLSDRASLDRSQVAFYDQVRALFAEKGISSTPPAELQIGADGHALVKNDHPQKREIEQLFAEQPKLRDELAALSASTSLSHAVDEAGPFREKYAKNPQAAVDQYSFLFDNHRSQDVSFVVGPDKLSELFGA